MNVIKNINLADWNNFKPCMREIMLSLKKKKKKREFRQGVSSVKVGVGFFNTCKNSITLPSGDIPVFSHSCPSKATFKSTKPCKRASTYF